MCKPHKKGWLNPRRLMGHKGFGTIRRLFASDEELKGENDAEYRPHPG